MNIKHDPQNVDYKKLGLKAGLEIHQQLATKKLFCNCPSEIREDKPHYTIVRQLRASAGESGGTDFAALHEMRKQKSFHYEGYNDTICLVELDEEPPHPINANAVHIGLQVAKMFKSTILPHVQVMRKTIIDGSNVSGFQRTMLYAIGGEMHGDFGDVRISAIGLEEDAAKIVERTPTHDVYNLSRLGIPLIEIATEPDLVTPEMVRDAAAHIGLILRSTRAVKRGLGTIRQDVNISIKEGSRVEIKGAQDLKMIPDMVRMEVARQAALVVLAKEIKEPNVGNVIDVTSQFSNAKGFIGTLVKKGASVVGVRVDGFADIFGSQLFPHYRVGTELAGYAKANGFGGIIHSDEDEKKYGVVFAHIAKSFDVKKDDAWFVLVGDADAAKRAIEQVILPRIKQLAHGVPSEVRKANADGTTTYLRPMPGASRMYPETDIPDVLLDEKGIKVPKLLTEQIADFAHQHKISFDLAKELIEHDWFEGAVKEYKKIPASLIAEIIVVYPKEIKKREGKDIENLYHILPEILEQLNKDNIGKDAVYELLVSAAHGKKLDFSQYEKLDRKEIEKIVAEVVAKNPDAPIGALMGQAMAKLRGKADGKLVMELLKKKN